LNYAPFVRVSASFGVLLMLTYWLAHMDWPFIENKNNLLIDYHLVYARVLVSLIHQADWMPGRVPGLGAYHGTVLCLAHCLPSTQRKTHGPAQ